MLDPNENELESLQDVEKQVPINNCYVFLIRVEVWPLVENSANKNINVLINIAECFYNANFYSSFQARNNLTALEKFRKTVPCPGILGVFIMRCYLQVDLCSRRKTGSCRRSPSDLVQNYQKIYF